MKLRIHLILIGLLIFAGVGFYGCQVKKEGVKEAGEEKAMPKAAKQVLFGFEEKTPNWEIPFWCLEQDDYVAESIAISRKFADEGRTSLEVMADFPGKRWTAAYVEVQQDFSWTPYRSISADVFLPKKTPSGLKAKFILTVGKDWTWTEMSRSVKLAPGQWTTVTASLIPGSTDWRGVQVTDAFRADVRKLGIRVESNMQPVYKGSIYIDNVRLE